MKLSTLGCSTIQGADLSIPNSLSYPNGTEDNVQPSDDEAVHDGDEDGDAEADQASLQHGGGGDLHQRACRDLRRCSEGGLR